MKRSRRIGETLLASVALLVGAVPASADPNNNNSAKLRRAVTVEDPGARTGLPGDRRCRCRKSSVGHGVTTIPWKYVAERAAAAGFDVEVQEFQYVLISSLIMKRQS